MSDDLPLNAAEPADAVAPKGALMAIFLIILVDFLGFGLIIPLLPFYVPDYESNPMKVTLIFAIYSICQFVGAPILGALSDRHGRRPVLIFSQLGSAAGYVLLGVASMGRWDPTTRLVLVYVSRIVDGFTGGNVSTAQAYISDVTTARNRAKGMGLIGAAFGIGFSLGPAMGGLLLHYVHLTAPAFAAAGLALLASLMTFARLPESRVHRPTEAGLWLHPSTFAPVFKKPIVTQLLLISFVSMAAFVMMEATAGIFLTSTYHWPKDQAARNTGWFFAYVGVIIVLVQGGLIRRLMKRGSEWPWAILGPALVAVGMAFYIGTAWRPTLLLLGLAGAVNALGRSLQQPTLSSLLSKHSDPKEQGMVFGLYHGLSSLARVFGPIIAGLTYPYLRNTGQFWTAGAIIAMAAVWTIAVRTQSRGTPAEQRGFGINEATGRSAVTEIE
jgi:DHA1 family tetracycline resistance protein-like MFS transporter